jgi:hypothetical protein
MVRAFALSLAHAGEAGVRLLFGAAPVTAMALWRDRMTPFSHGIDRGPTT